MAESFTITVSWKNQDRQFEAELRMLGYTYKIAVMVDGTEVIFEPDEERNFRAMVPADTELRKTPPAALLEAIAGELETNLK
jgi:hypothetical protein